MSKDIFKILSQIFDLVLFESVIFITPFLIFLFHLK